jgi:endonuclease/exonuclease/phosphatase family metal-dependent hydrolase
MATRLADIDEISTGMEKFKFSKDDSETQITVCTWNINGSARAWLRKIVTTDTFNLQQYQDGTKLGQSDIICVQEMTTHPERATTQQYLPFARDYGVVWSKEPTGNKYNAVYFNKEKFSQVADGCLTRAYNLMDIKKRWYERKVPGERKTIDPSILLKRRMAICVLKIKSLPEKYNIIVVVSVHNYRVRSGRENYAALLFDFLSKLPHNFIVIIAGDFNFDITDRCPALTQWYHIPWYDLRPLRSGLTTIDFIVVTKSETYAKLQVSVSEVQAHDLLVDDEIDNEIKKDPRKITNHSPVSAVIELKLNYSVAKLYLFSEI